MSEKNELYRRADSGDSNLGPVPRADDAAVAGMSRRGFLGLAAVSIFVAHADSQSARFESRSGIPYRTLGRTGEKVSLIGLGGYHLGKQADPQESIRIIRAGLDEGINFLDNCWDYNGGESEIRMGNRATRRLSTKSVSDVQDRRAHKSSRCQSNQRISAAPSN